MSIAPEPTGEVLSRADHERLVAGLPWYVNGTLAPEEAAWIAVLGERSAHARRLISEERRLAACVGAIILPAPQDVGGERLRLRLAADAQAADAPPIAAREPGRPVWMLSKSAALAARPAVLAGLLGLVVLQSIALLHYQEVAQRDAAQQKYSPIRAPLAVGQPLLRVRFVAQASFAQIQEQLSASSAQIVAGPDLTGDVWLRSRLFSAVELKQRLLGGGLVSSASEDPQGPQ